MRFIFLKTTNVIPTCILLLWLLTISNEILGAKAKGLKKCGKKNKKNCKKSSITSFDEWAIWKDKFRMCNPKNNAFLSPINILTEKAIQTKEQTLIVYSGDPVDVYTYSSLYKVEEDGVAIEAINIGLRNKEVYRDATYIAGLGNSEYRFFQRALILFTKSDVEPERSTHQIDGKKFPMEIVFYFEDIAKTDQTQIHVLYELIDIGSPGWFWNADATTQLNQLLDTVGTDNEEKERKVALKLYNNTKVKVDKLLALEKNLTNETSGGYETLYNDLVLLHKLVESAENTTLEVRKRKDMSKKVKEYKNLQHVALDDIPKMEAKLQSALDEVERQRRTGELQRSQENSATDFVQELKDKKAQLLITSIVIRDKLRTYEETLHDMEKEIKIKTTLLQKYKIGKGKGNLFKSVKEVLAKKKFFQARFNNLTLEQGKLSELKNDMETKDAMEPRDVIIPSKFQISWLFPSIGGYYRYNGSGVVPPCKKRTHVIVMEKPVQLLDVVFHEFIEKIHKGRKQADIDSFVGDPNTDIPIIDKAIPILRQLGDRKIWYNRKNLQFKLDDGWHMKSSLRRKLKDQMRMSTGPPPANQVDEYTVFFIISAVTAAFIRFL